MRAASAASRTRGRRRHLKREAGCAPCGAEGRARRASPRRNRHGTCRRRRRLLLRRRRRRRCRRRVWSSESPATSREVKGLRSYAPPPEPSASSRPHHQRCHRQVPRAQATTKRPRHQTSGREAAVSSSTGLGPTARPRRSRLCSEARRCSPPPKRPHHFRLRTRRRTHRRHRRSRRSPPTIPYRRRHSTCRQCLHSPHCPWRRRQLSCRTSRAWRVPPRGWPRPPVYPASSSCSRRRRRRRRRRRAQPAELARSGRQSWRSSSASAPPEGVPAPTRHTMGRSERAPSSGSARAAGPLGVG